MIPAASAQRNGRNALELRRLRELRRLAVLGQARQTTAHEVAEIGPIWNMAWRGLPSTFVWCDSRLRAAERDTLVCPTCGPGVDGSPTSKPSRASIIRASFCSWVLLLRCCSSISVHQCTTSALHHHRRETRCSSGRARMWWCPTSSPCRTPGTDSSLTTVRSWEAASTGAEG